MNWKRGCAFAGIHLVIAVSLLIWDEAPDWRLIRTDRNVPVALPDYQPEASSGPDFSFNPVSYTHLEFERQACVDIYSVLIAAGLELSQSGHIRFTELCQCTRSNQLECDGEIASIDLEIQAYPREAMRAAAGH